MIRSPIPRKRLTPRRVAPERITAARIKRRANELAAEKAHVSRVRAMPCLVCGAKATVHHVTGYADRMGRIARSDALVVPLCKVHHQKVHDPLASDPVSVEGLGHRGFYAKHGIDLHAVAAKLWEESNDR